MTVGSKHSFVIKIEQFLKNIFYCYVSLKIRMKLINQSIEVDVVLCEVLQTFSHSEEFQILLINAD